MNDGDGFEDLATLRRLVPAAWGQCGKAESVAHASGELGRYRPILDVDAPGVQGERHYLVLKLSDRSVTDFSVAFQHGSRTDTVKVERSKLLPNSGLFFVELSNTKAALESVSVDLPAGAAGKWDARICTAPR